MYTCAFCKRPVNWNAAWRGREQRLYCNEFCAETEDTIDETVAKAATLKLTQHLNGGSAG
jgi:hypothetical protein